MDGGWGRWESWSECSVTCGGGQQQKVRYCDSPEPRDGGLPCAGRNKETRECNIWDCPGEVTFTKFLAHQIVNTHQ